MAALRHRLHPADLRAADLDEAPRVAVVPVRNGVLPAGGLETIAEAGGVAVLIGESPTSAVADLEGVATEVTAIDAGAFAAGADAALLAPLLTDTPVVLLPASPDGRDLAPRLAAELERPLHANAMQVRSDTVTLVRHDGAVLAETVITGPCVITLQPGVRTVLADDALGEAVVDTAAPGTAAPDAAGPVTADLDVAGLDGGDPNVPVAAEAVAIRDAESVSVLAPDVTTMDLSEAPRILGGGAGLDSAARFDQLARVAAKLGASMGATRVVTDRGWLGHSRQIGTTGVVVDPDLYISFGISGAVQHTAGLGDPDHIITVNTDPHCPMMEMADLAVVAEANETLEELAVLIDALMGDTAGEGEAP